MIPTNPYVWKKANFKVTNNIFKVDTQLIFGSFGAAEANAGLPDIYTVSNAFSPADMFSLR